MLRLLTKACQRLPVYVPNVFCSLLLADLVVVAAKADEGQGVNGGQLAKAGSGYVEFIGGAGYELMMFAVSDLEKRPLPISNGFAVVIVRQNNRQYRVPLRPDGDGFLSARAYPPLTLNASVMFIAELASGARFEARFTPR
jgi:hypothetical protein